MIVFSIVDKPLQCGSGLILIAVGTPVYFLFVHKSPESPVWWKNYTRYMFKTMNCQLEEISGLSSGVRSPRRLLSTSEIIPTLSRSRSRASENSNNSSIRCRNSQSASKNRIDVDV